jgi:hypothetical protein
VNLLPRSWLFQIVDAQSKQIEAAFTLVLPPQQLSVKEKQRVTITKTFGNAFIDDYGPDNKEITIRGISGTSSVFPTYSPSGVTSGTGSEIKTFKTLQEKLNSPGATTGYDARSAFYTFRDTIMRYKEKFSADFDKKELHVYDLWDEQAYKCILLDFTLDRTADKPFYYTYTISLFVYEDLMGKDAFKPQPIPVGGNINSIFDTLDKLFSWSTAFSAPFKQIGGQIATVNATLNLIKARWNTALSDVRYVIESPLKLTQQMLQGCLTLGSMIGDTYEAGKMVVQDYTSFTEVVKGMVTNTLHMYGIAISTQSTQSNTIVVNEDDGVATSDTLAGENDREVQTNTFIYYGYTVHTLSQGDTLQGLALSYLGDPDLWVFIASVNGIQGNEDLTGMETIYIPVPVEAGSVKDLFVLSEDPQRDPYGSDLRIDTLGNLVVGEEGDLALVSGLTNIIQAVNLRMQTSPGSLIRQTAFGLLSSPGDAGTDAALSYVRTAFRLSLIADTRIRDATNIQVVFAGGSVYLSADIEVIGIDRTLPVSVQI